MKISTGIKKQPYFVLIYGPDGVGKTTFAADAPSPIIVGPESGSAHINVARAEDIRTYADVRAALRWLLDQKHDYRSVGLDSLDWIEPLIWNHICEMHGVQGIEDVGGGFGKGYTEALTHWKDLIDDLVALRMQRNMNVIAIAHAQVKAFNDPNQANPYDRYSLKLNEKAAAKWREAVDVVGFTNFEDSVVKVNKGDRKFKAIGGDVRKMYVQRKAAYDAKNRLGLPVEFPFSFAEFDKLADLGMPDSIEAIQSELTEIMKVLEKTDPEMCSRMKEAVTKAGTDIVKLTGIRKHARVIVKE